MSTPRSLEMPYRVRSVMLPTSRGDFAVLEAQPGHGVCERRPALLVPGYTGSKEDFLPVLEPLAAADRTVVAMDLRGQYQSPHAASRDGYDPGELAADVLAVAAAVSRQAGWERGSPGIHLVGHSMGGLVARHATLAAAARTGDQQAAGGPDGDQAGVLSLTLLGSGPGAIAGERAAALRELLAVLDPHAGRHGDDRGALAAIVARIWQERLEPQARLDGTDDAIVAFLCERTHKTCPVGLIAMARYLLTCPDRTDELAVLTRPRDAAGLPALVICGEDDDAWPPAVQRRMARRLKAEWACIPASAHSPAVEAPETTARALTTFWNAVERRPVPHLPA